MLEEFFKLKDKGTNVKTEVIAGITTFLTMAYIIFVNPQILSQAGMDKGALIAVTAIVTAASTLLMGLWPKVPIAMAPGMGMNAFFAYTLVLSNQISWQTALGIVFLSGLFFLILTVVGVREKILNAMPKSIVNSISVGIGLFITFIGLQNLGIIVDNPATLVGLGEFTPQVMIGLLGLLLIAILWVKNVKGAMLIGIVFSTILALVFGYVEMPGQIFSLSFDLSPIAFQLDIMAAMKWSLLGSVFTLMYLDLFDSLGTLIACSHQAKLVGKDGSVKKISKMLGADAIATMFGALMGTSTTTSYIESASGIAEGGRSGLTSVVTGLLFLLALFFIPIIGVVPAYATAPALIIVGLFMIKQVSEIDFLNLEESIPAYLTMVIMPLTFQISTGLAFGFLAWGLIKMLLLKFDEISGVMYVVMALSLLSLVV